MDSKQIGLEYLRKVWWKTACDVVEKAIIVYKLDEKQAAALRKAYLKPNHYLVRIR